MSKVQLFGLTDSGPVQLSVPEGAKRFEDLYEDMTLGVYSSFRTFEHNKFLDLGHHIQRTERSMERLGWTYVLNNKRLRQSLHEVCTAYDGNDMRVRIDVLSEPVTVGTKKTHELIALMPFQPPSPTIYENGVRVATTQKLSRSNPLVKSAGFVKARQQHVDPRKDVYEQLLVNQNGEILEGFSSNFYGVIEGKVYTAAKGILEGITRRIILDRLADFEIPVCFQPVNVNMLEDLEEAAISSSSRGLVPVIAIDDRSIGDGAPGPIFRQVIQDYQTFIRLRIQPAVSDI